MPDAFRLVKQIDPVAIVTGGLVPKGAYNAGTAYSMGDSVSYNGSSYVAITSTTGNLPTDTTKWQLIAQAGSAGSGGTTSDATTTAKGIVQLAGDLAGTAAAPTVPGLTTKQSTLVSGTNIKTINGTTLLGSGDITITGGGGVSSVSVTTANGVSGTVANSTTTPAISLSLGAVTPTSVSASGTVTGSNLSGTNTGDQTTITGNAGSASKLLTARAINGVSFDGTTDITIADSTKAPLASPALTGTPTAPTPTAGDNSTNISTTAFVTTAILNAASTYDDVKEYVNLAGFPVTGTTGYIYVADDTGYLYRWSGSAYIQVGGGIPADASTSSKGIVQLAGDLAGTAISPTVPGLANKANVSGQVFTGTISATNLSGTNTGDQTSVTGNAGTATTLQTARVIGTLTGDVTSAGSGFNGSAVNTNATTLATVNSNVGTFGSASSVNVQTVNAKGLTTAASSVPIQIAESQVTSLTTDLAAKQDALVSGSNIKTINGTSLLGSGDVTIASGGSGTVTTTSVVSANGFAGTVAAATTTPAITLSTSVTGVIKGNGTSLSAAAAETDYTTPTGVGTLTNKRVTKRTNTLTVSTSTYTPNGDTTDVALIASPTANFTLANPAGTPTDGQTLIIRITSGSTPYTATYGTTYSTGVTALPTTFIASSVVNLGFIYNAALTKWVLEANDQVQTMYLPAQIQASSSKTAAYSIVSTDGMLYISTATASVTITLPDATTVPGRKFGIKKTSTDTNTLSIATVSSQTIEAVASPFTTVATTRPSYTLASDGSNWWLT